MSDIINCCKDCVPFVLAGVAAFAFQDFVNLMFVGVSNGTDSGKYKANFSIKNGLFHDRLEEGLANSNQERIARDKENQGGPGTMRAIEISERREKFNNIRGDAIKY